MKTVYEVIEEYNNRQIKPEYKRIVIRRNTNNEESTYILVSNVKQNFTANWVEFDAVESKLFSEGTEKYM